MLLPLPVPFSPSTSHGSAVPVPVCDPCKIGLNCSTADLMPYHVVWVMVFQALVDHILGKISIAECTVHSARNLIVNIMSVLI